MKQQNNCFFFDIKSFNFELWLINSTKYNIWQTLYAIYHKVSVKYFVSFSTPKAAIFASGVTTWENITFGTLSVNTHWLLSLVKFYQNKQKSTSLKKISYCPILAVNALKILLFFSELNPLTSYFQLETL